MTFSRSKCVIRKIYCGEGRPPADTYDVKYSRKGSRAECLKRGFGAAMWAQKKKDLSRNSLQQISYIGPVYEKNFKRLKLGTIPKLIDELSNKTAAQKKDIITKVNGSAITTTAELLEQIGRSKVGETLELTVVRLGKTVPVSVKLRSRPEGN